MLLPPMLLSLCCEPHLQLLHAAVGHGGGVLPLAIALSHAEERVQVKGLQPAGASKARGRLQMRREGAGQRSSSNAWAGRASEGFH